MEKETVMKKCCTDILGLENLKKVFDNFYNDAMENVCDTDKYTSVKADITEMICICRGMLERLTNISKTL